MEEKTYSIELFLNDMANITFTRTIKSKEIVNTAEEIFGLSEMGPYREDSDPSIKIFEVFPLRVIRVDLINLIHEKWVGNK